MPVSIEVLDIAPMAKDKRPVPRFVASIEPGVYNAGVSYTKPTGEHPICIVSCREDNKEADIYWVAPHRYMPVYMAPNLWQIVVSDVDTDEFPMRLLATLTPENRSFQIQIKKGENKTGEFANFFLEN